jgi:hypothetical protein
MQQQTAQPLPSLGGMEMEGGSGGTRTSNSGRILKGFENLVKDATEHFVCLLVPESKVLSKNKPIKRGAINEKTLPVMKAHFDSKAKARIPTVTSSRSSTS